MEILHGFIGFGLGLALAGGIGMATIVSPALTVERGWLEHDNRIFVVRPAEVREVTP